MSETGLVTSSHRRHVVVETHDGRKLRCIVRGRKLRVLVGDEVTIMHHDDGTTFVDSLADRETLLTRIDARGRPEGVAANVTQIAVVVAPRPAVDWLLVDRYFAAAELEGIVGLLVWNKSDLARSDTDARTSVYAATGYRVIEASAETARGLAALADALGGERSVLVGQSGVGKSSLINALLGETAQAVGELSDRRALGRHTTTAAELYRLPNRGELIDSPGVRQYAPHLSTPARLDWAYREFRPFLGRCRFDDCRHDAEPGCAIKLAITDGSIDARRHASYLTLRETLGAFAR
jgi:ribosome biogenesis GTPase